MHNAALKFAVLLTMLVSAQPVLPQRGSESLRIGPGDLLSVHVFRENELETKGRVKDAGTLTLPLIGAVPVAGLAAADAADLIAQRYSAGGFLNRPQVSVQIEESTAQQVAVLGEVAHPGTVQVSSPRSLLDVLASAGGLLKTADRHITIRHSSGQSQCVLAANDAAQELAAAGGIKVSPGDTVLVPRAGIVYVLGDVGRPGGYLMQDDAKLTLLQALSLAAGTTKTARESGVRLLRTLNGVTMETPLHLHATEHGKAPDLSLENNDIVYVPFSLAKNMALGASSIAASAASAVIYSAW